jgi:hypothetical protein
MMGTASGAHKSLKFPGRADELHTGESERFSSTPAGEIFFHKPMFGRRLAWVGSFACQQADTSLRRLFNFMWRVLVMVRLYALFCSAVLFAGCSIAVDPLNPKPNVVSPDRPVKLEIASDIGDTYEIPSKNGMKKVKVVGWHGSLQKGFDNAFGKESGAPSTMKVVLTRAELDFEPTAYLVDRYGHNVGAAGAQAQVTYAAKLVASDGSTVRTSNRTVIAKKSFSSANGSESVQSAVESMYELMAQDLFAK